MRRRKLDVSIRSLTDTDIAAVCDLHARSFAALARESHNAEEIAAHVEYIGSLPYVSEILTANLRLALAASGEIIGTAGWQVMPERPETARIRKVFVHPDVARRGLGRLLVGEAEFAVRAAGLRNFFVRANVNAVPLYRALGYSELEFGTMPVAGGVALPVMFMEKLQLDG